MLMKPCRSTKLTLGPHFRANLTGGFGAVLLLAGWIVFTGISAGVAASADKLAGNWYLRLSQWRADVRTLAACAAYVVRGDSGKAAGF
jgi:hypothetical protein